MLREKDNASKYRDVRRAHWDGVARKADNWTSWGTYYHRRFEEIYSFLIAPGQRVLENGNHEITRGLTLAKGYPELVWGHGVGWRPHLEHIFTLVIVFILIV